MKANKETITAKNVVNQCIEANFGTRAMNSSDIHKYAFDCNIQQIKRKEFEILYYGLFFADRIDIFRMYSYEIISCPGYSDFQHKGNEGEGQFHLNQASIDYHMKNNHIKSLGYVELYNMFMST